MGDSCRFVLPGAPRGKQVARVTRFGSYTPKQTRAEMDALRQIARIAMEGRAPFTGPVELKLAAYMPIPKSWSQKKRAEAEAGRLWPVVKPDGSNIQKLCEDAILPPHIGKKDRATFPAALLRVVIADDAQIVKWQGWKLYSTDPRVVVEVREID